jgi:hypothetical protein
MIATKRVFLPMLEHKTNRHLFPGFIRPNAAILLALLLATLAISPPLAAEEHVVSRDELRQQILSARQTREDQLRSVRKFFSSDAVREGLRSAGLDAKQVRNAVSLLDDGELARLADRTRRIESDLSAGALTNEQLTYIVIALATAVVVILAT